MLVDSHCHLDFPDFQGRVPDLLAAMRQNDVRLALCIGVELEAFPQVRALAESHPELYATVGVHPDHAPGAPVSEEELLRLAGHPRVRGVGETGLDYYRLGRDLPWQKDRFRAHIRAARACGKPLVIHTREAGADTLAILREEKAADVGGVMHCFTETWEVARAALDLGFMISFSGILTFRNAEALRDVARRVPADGMLVETDSPYLAPVPWRGKTNQPAYVRHVAEMLAGVRGETLESVSAATTANFCRLFRVPLPDSEPAS